MAYVLLHNILHMMNEKQIDNISKYCYDVSKLIMGIAVVGNLVSDKSSLHALWIGFSAGIVFLIIGYFIDKMEIDKNDKH